MGVPIDDASASSGKRAQAEGFFKALKDYLSEELPSVNAVNQEISQAKKRFEQTGEEGARAYEGPFFKMHVVPAVHKFLTRGPNSLASEAAKQALLAEGHVELKAYASGTPASPPIYPYKKTLAGTLKTARKDWWGSGKVLSSSCPDLALRLPSGLSIVFEGKLFRSDSAAAAKSAIVDGIYECFFYRALPTLMKSEELKSSGYEYACLLAYDASPKGSLVEAWNSINADIERSCREALNILVMVVRNDRE